MIPDSLFKIADKYSGKADIINEIPCSVISLPGSNSASIAVSFGSGVMYEPRDLWGISHFIEHILFRGSKLFPSLYEISRAIEGIGGRISAYSTRNFSSFWVKTPPGFEDKALNILCDLFSNPLLKPEDILSERDIIVQERFRERSNPSFFNSLLIEEILLSPLPISRMPVGSEKVINALNPQILSEHIKKYYNKNNMFIGAAGNIRQDFKDDLKNFSSRFDSGNPPKEADFVLDNNFDGKKIFYLKSNHKTQVFLSAGWRIKIDNPDEIFTWRVLGSILGAGYTSLLNKKLREDENVTYVCMTGLNFYKNTGIFKTNLSFADRNFKRVLSLIQEVIDRISSGDLDDKIFVEGKIKHASSLLFRMEDNLETAKILSQYLLNENKFFSLRDYLANIHNVTKEEIINAAGILSEENRKILFQTGSDLAVSNFKGTDVVNIT
ncbi:MAG: insulinase family protein [Candidatus Eremiobacteraeota bacterium]|nr:insulinase family protein [Candidatus Eremiobacteraeota bacterium]